MIGLFMYQLLHLSNGGGGGTVGRRDVVHLGRTLVENGEIDLGHVCMLFV